MNNKKLKVLSLATLSAVTAVSAVSSASAETRWHVGVDVGLSQYKQERKKNKYPKYKDANETFDKEIKTFDDMISLMTELRNMTIAYHNAKIQTEINTAINNINNAPNNMVNITNIFNNILQQAGYSNPEIQNITATHVPGVAAMNVGNARNQMAAFLNSNNFAKKNNLGVPGNDFNFTNTQNKITALQNSRNSLAGGKTSLANLMKKQGDKVEDLMSGEALEKYDKGTVNTMNGIITELASFLLIGQAGHEQNGNYIDFAKRPNGAVQQWAAANNWYGNNNHSANYQALVAKFEAIKKAKENDYPKLLKDIKVKRQETEKVSSGRINSPVVEGNIGVTEQFDKGVLGADLIIGINCKEFGKKKKTDIYKQQKTPVYIAVIGRAGFMISDTVEPYVLAGLRVNNPAPIVGAGMRFYEKSKAYFFKAEFQKTLGKKYPKGHTIKLGFGWTL